MSRSNFSYLTIKLEGVSAFNFSRFNIPVESASGKSQTHIEFIPEAFSPYRGYINRSQPSPVHNEFKDAVSQVSANSHGSAPLSKGGLLPKTSTTASTKTQCSMVLQFF